MHRFPQVAGGVQQVEDFHPWGRAQGRSGDLPQGRLPVHQQHPGVLVVGVAPVGLGGQPGEHHLRRARRGQGLGHGGGHRQHRAHPLLLGDGPAGSGPVYRAGRRDPETARRPPPLGSARAARSDTPRPAPLFSCGRAWVPGRGRGRRWPRIGRFAQRTPLPSALNTTICAPSPAPPPTGPLHSPLRPRPRCGSSSPGWPPTASNPGCAPAPRRPGRRDSPPPGPDSSPARHTSTGPPATPAGHPGVRPRSAGLPACRRRPVPG